MQNHSKTIAVSLIPMQNSRKANVLCWFLCKTTVKPTLFRWFLCKNHCETIACSLVPMQNHSKTIAFVWFLCNTIVKQLLFRWFLCTTNVKPVSCGWFLCKTIVKHMLFRGNIWKTLGNTNVLHGNLWNTLGKHMFPIETHVKTHALEPAPKNKNKLYIFMITVPKWSHIDKIFQWFGNHTRTPKNVQILIWTKTVPK